MGPPTIVLHTNCFKDKLKLFWKVAFIPHCQKADRKPKVEGQFSGQGNQAWNWNAEADAESSPIEEEDSKNDAWRKPVVCHWLPLIEREPRRHATHLLTDDRLAPVNSSSHRDWTRRFFWGSSCFQLGCVHLVQNEGEKIHLLDFLKTHQLT